MHHLQLPYALMLSIVRRGEIVRSARFDFANIKDYLQATNKWADYCHHFDSRNFLTFVDCYCLQLRLGSCVTKATASDTTCNEQIQRLLQFLDTFFNDDSAHKIIWHYE